MHVVAWIGSTPLVEPAASSASTLPPNRFSFLRSMGRAATGGNQGVVGSRRSTVVLRSLVLCLAVASSAIGCGEAGDDTNGGPSSAYVIREASPRITADTAFLPPGCEPCSIEVTSTMVLGDLDDPVLMRVSPSAVRDRRGRTYLYGSGAMDHEVLVFDSSGSYQTSLGRSGQGPGEYRQVNSLTILPGDSVLMISDFSRVSVFAPDGEFARSFTLPFTPYSRAVYLPGSGVAVAGGIPTPDQAVLPLHLLDDQGQVVRSFGTPNLRGGQDLPNMRIVGLAADSGSFWAAERQNYRLERTTHDGVIKRIIGVRSTRLFPLPPLILDGVPETAPLQGTGRRISAGRSPPLGLMSSIYEDSDERLWVAVRVAARDWVARSREMPAVDPRTGHRSDEGLVATVVDVIDAESGRVLATRYFDRRGFLANDGSLMVPRQRPDGLIQVEIYTLQLSMN